uniref:Uncharacterized protein n=1 Tax=Glossina palpalis gambiensis TaxID=67801 RepID=A0A1B0B7Z4_9MUSC
MSSLRQVDEILNFRATDALHIVNVRRKSQRITISINNVNARGFNLNELYIPHDKRVHVFLQLGKCGSTETDMTLLTLFVAPVKKYLNFKGLMG